MESLIQDIRYAVRTLLKKPGFTGIAVLALALGIGANTAIFSVINAILLRPLPLAEADRLVLASEFDTKIGKGGFMTSFPNYEDWRAQNQVFDDVAAFRSTGFTLTGFKEAERIDSGSVSANFFDLLRVSPILGRTFLPGEDKPGSERLVVLSYGLWQRLFAGDTTVPGRTLMLSDEPYTIIGVLPAEFKFPVSVDDAKVFTTIAFEGGNLQERGAKTNRVVARLKPGVTIEQAQADMRNLAASLEKLYPQTNTDIGIELVGLHDDLVADVRPALWVLFGAVAFVLLIACSNVANLLLARASSRQKEIAIRTALGASRWRIVRQLLTESLILGLAGGALGLLIGAWGKDFLISFAPANLPQINAVGIDIRVLAFTFTASILTGIIFGLMPALKASHPDMNESLKDGSRSSTAGPGRHRLRGLLVVSEVALAFMLLIGAGLLIKSFFTLRQVNPGFDPENVLMARISTSRTKFPEDQQRIEFFQQVLDRIRALPGVKSADLVTPAPFSGNNVYTGFTIEGRPSLPGQEPEAGLRGVTPGYFKTMRIPLLKGREFTDADRKGGIGAVILNETLARRYWPDENPIGQRISNVGVNVDDNEPAIWEIVGIVGDVRHSGLSRDLLPEMYVPHRQQTWGWGNFVVRASGDPMSLASAIRGEVAAVDPDQPVYRISPIEELIANSIAQQRFNTLLLVIFAAVGLVLALVGIYGVISYSVTERTHEIGIRMALGAGEGAILRNVLGKGMSFAGAGIVCGIAGALALMRVLSVLLYGVSATDPVTFIAVSLLLIVVALVACYVPARRATKVDPMVALRYE